MPVSEAGGGRRPVLRAAGLGVAVGVLLGATALAVVALPLLFFAQAVEPGQAMDRPLVRTGLLGVALPVSGVVGAVGGVASAVWYRRGGRLPREETRAVGG